MNTNEMNRRTLFKLAAASAVATHLPASAEDLPRLAPPPKGRIPVAFLVSKGAVVIDFAGPWEVFQDVRDFSRGDAVAEVAAFAPYLVAANMSPVVASGGFTVVPNYTFDNAPQPKIIVIPAQGGVGEAELTWLKKASAQADMTMSICTGAFVLARTGLLDGQSATTHHSAFDSFEKLYPKIKLQRGVRFVDHGNIATSAGLSAGIDLSLHVVARYFGVSVALQTAKQLEYQSEGWKTPDAGHEHRPDAPKEPPTNATGYICPPCGCAADGRVFAKAGSCPACGMQLIKKG